MSIYGNAEAVVGYDFETSEFSDEQGKVRTYPDGFSNAYPERSDVIFNPAAICFTSICSWCVPGHQGGADFETTGPWLRLEVDAPESPDYWSGGGEKPSTEDLHVMVLLDEQAVRSMRDQLTRWLDSPKVYPIEDAA